jgi:ATP-dependent DNA helicase DinG
MGNARLAEVFHSDVHSVLLATRSFFEGVDFPGDSCSVVAVMRFPNVRPDDPLTLARRRSVESRGGSGWAEYQEPVMQLVFRQAAGRVIRRVDDRGVVAVLDPRSGSKGYARRALLGLVPSDFTMSLGDVGKFLEPR